LPSDKLDWRQARLLSAPFSIQTRKHAHHSTPWILAEKEQTLPSHTFYKSKAFFSFSVYLFSLPPFFEKGVQADICQQKGVDDGNQKAGPGLPVFF